LRIDSLEEGKEKRKIGKRRIGKRRIGKIYSRADGTVRITS
jgi:hypothetical protein